MVQLIKNVLIENPEDIEIRSEEVQEILGTPPAWLIRWGTTIAFFVIIGIISVSWFVKYPDIIPAKVLITTPSQPASVITRSGGYLQKLLVANEDSVTAGQQLVIMESNANVADVLALEKKLEWLQEKNSRISRFKPNRNWKLGQFQASLSRLMQIQKEYKMTNTKRFDLKKIEQVERQIEKVKDLKKALAKREENEEQVLALAKRNYERSKTLVKEGVISPKQFEDEESAFLQKKQTVDGLETQIINYDIQIANLESQINEIEQSTDLQNSSKIISVVESVNEMLSEINTWKQQYILTAPISGKVSFTFLTEERQFIEGGKEIMIVVPNKEMAPEGNAKLPIAGSGKVEVGRVVNIKLDGFPFQEYGMIKGQVKALSAVPREGHYDLLIELPEGMTTTYKKDLRFQQKMEGVAEVITKDRTLLERIFEQLISAFKNQ